MAKQLTDGSLAVILVEGNDPVGILADDGSMNVAITDDTGIYTPGGAVRVTMTDGDGNFAVAVVDQQVLSAVDVDGTTKSVTITIENGAITAITTVEED